MTHIPKWLAGAALLLGACLAPQLALAQDQELPEVFRGGGTEPATEAEPIEDTDDGKALRLRGGARDVEQVTVVAGPAGGALGLSDARGRPRVELDSSGPNGGVAALYNARDREVVSMGGGPNDDGRLIVANRDGEAKVVVTTYKDGILGVITISGREFNDYAEIFELDTRDGVAPGTVMAVTETGGRLRPSAAAYERSVVGVISGAGEFRPGMVVGQRADGTGDLAVAVAGRVYVRVCAENGPVAAGDLLVASSSPGVAMRADDPGRAFGAVVGKALEPYADDGPGLVQMLVMTR